ncbi:uncharacterized protein LOC144577225 [Callithrix jacchus]
MSTIRAKDNTGTIVSSPAPGALTFTYRTPGDGSRPDSSILPTDPRPQPAPSPGPASRFGTGKPPTAAGGGQSRRPVRHRGGGAESSCPQLLGGGCSRDLLASRSRAPPEERAAKLLRAPRGQRLTRGKTLKTCDVHRALNSAGERSPALPDYPLLIWPPHMRRTSGEGAGRLRTRKFSLQGGVRTLGPRGSWGARCGDSGALEPSAGGEAAVLWSSTDWMMPTHIGEGDLPYSATD